MGASQSSSGGAATPPEVKTSYYELLSVERHATEDEIKRAYRRRALELHPDRNFGKEEEATKLFAEIQAAYEVLSDPQERAWYDSHESEILHGGEAADSADGAHYEANVRVTTTDDIARMFKKFNRNIDFSDKPTGFYGFLRETFEQLAKEEEAAARWDGEEPRDYPSFGHKDDTYEDVVKSFYGEWASFSTQKTFAWKDKWRLTDAPDRQVRRLMEKENSQLRKEAVREFNDAVRTLVSFVRKRDPRYTPVVITDAERQKTLRDAAAAQAARARAENEAKLRATDAVPDWARTRASESLDDEEEEEEEEVEEFECVACRKSFKSERQFEAHEKSKKHQKAIQALKKKMRRDNRELDLDDVVGDDTKTPISDEETLISTPDNPARNYSAAATGREDTAQSLNGLTMEDEETESSSIDTKVEETKGPPGHKVAQATDPSASEDEYASREDVKARLGREGNTLEDENQEIDVSDSSARGSKAPAPAAKTGAAAKKRAKKAAQAQASNADELKFKCTVCNAAFPSKSRMFQHIADQGHAALKSDSGGAKKKKGKR